jgi:two-component system, cell cycle response regulator
MRILIAEDDNMQRNVLRALLTKVGHEVAAACDGQEAWDLLQQEHIRLVITDWMMPNLSGLQLIQKIRAAGWTSYTYILLLTSKDLKENIVEGLQAGADDYLTKPFDKNELVARLGIGDRILELEGRLAHMATHDILTGLFNRRALYDIALSNLQKTAAGGVISFIMVDLDHFKDVNDTYGHMAGDQTLRVIAGVLQENTPAGGAVGRWGGEEFLVCLPGLDCEEVLQAAEQIRRSVAGTTVLLADGKTLQVTCSLGVSSSDDCMKLDLETLVGQADEALYRAKSSGRNCICSHIL